MTEDFKGKAQLDRFIESLRADKKSGHTIKAYEKGVKLLLTKVDKEAAEITADDLEKCKFYMATEKGYNPNSMAQRITSWKVFFKFLGMNTAEKIKFPKKGKRLPEVLSEDEVKRILITAKKDPMAYAVISLLYYAGLRRSEITKLTLQDIDFEQQMLKIRSGKGNKDGNVFLTPEAVNILKEYLEYREKYVEVPKDKEGMLFVSRQKREITQNNEKVHDGMVEWFVKKYSAKAEIKKKVHPHMFRHSIATHMLNHGASLLHIQRHLRHSDINSTLIYVHLADGEAKKVCNATIPSLFDVKKKTEPIIKEQVLPTMKSNIQVLTNQKKLDLLEQRLLNGEIPADIYRELKEKYADKTHSENLHQKKADTSYIM